MGQPAATPCARQDLREAVRAPIPEIWETRAAPADELEERAWKVTIDVEAAAARLLNFAQFWQREPDGEERNNVLRIIFESFP
jgi:hypothetical protein